MDYGLWAGLAFLMFALVSAAVALHAAYLDGRNATGWELLPAWSGVRYSAPRRFDPLKLSRAVALAISALSAVWPTDSLYRVVRESRFIVHEGPSRIDNWGADPPGESIGDYVLIGEDLNGLAHELAHRCEAVLEHNPMNEHHLMWHQRGITAAVAAYEVRWEAENVGA